MAAKKLAAEVVRLPEAQASRLSSAPPRFRGIHKVLLACF